MCLWTLLCMFARECWCLLYYTRVFSHNYSSKSYKEAMKCVPQFFLTYFKSTFSDCDLLFKISNDRSELYKSRSDAHAFRFVNEIWWTYKKDNYLFIFFVYFLDILNQLDNGSLLMSKSLSLLCDLCKARYQPGIHVTLLPSIGMIMNGIPHAISLPRPVWTIGSSINRVR